jgi:hypothetical protein
LTEIYVAAFPEVPYDDPAWDADPSTWESTDVLDYDWPDDRTPDRNWKGRGDDVTLLAPVCGGADPDEVDTGEWPVPPPIAGGCDGPFVPSPEDWAACREWADACDCIDECNDARDGESPA